MPTIRTLFFTACLGLNLLALSACDHLPPTQYDWGNVYAYEHISNQQRLDLEAAGITPGFVRYLSRTAYVPRDPRILIVLSQIYGSQNLSLPEFATPQQLGSDIKMYLLSSTCSTSSECDKNDLTYDDFLKIKEAHFPSEQGKTTILSSPENLEDVANKVHNGGSPDQVVADELIQLEKAKRGEEERRWQTRNEPYLAPTVTEVLTQQNYSSLIRAGVYPEIAQKATYAMLHDSGSRCASLASYIVSMEDFHDHGTVARIARDNTAMRLNNDGYCDQQGPTSRKTKAKKKH